MLNIEADLITTLASFSRVGDLNDLSFLAHAERVAYTAVRLGEILGLTEEDLEELLLSSLLHDIGVITSEEKLSLADLKPQRGITALHCQRGYDLVQPTRQLGFLASNILEHHDYYTPRMNMIPAIIHLADRLDFLLQKDRYYLWQVPDILAYFDKQKTGIFHPHVVEALAELAQIAGFWLDLQHSNHNLWLQERITVRKVLRLDGLKELAGLMATLVDSTSPFTGGHSHGVSRISQFLAEQLGFSEERAQLAQIAGLLHDVGKMAVPDEILLHPGNLTKEQAAIMRQHVYHTYYLLGNLGTQCNILQKWAGYHHERPNGTGYPFALEGKQLDTGARLVAVADITQSLLEERPYRSALDTPEVAAILSKEAQEGNLDADLAHLAIAHLDEIKPLIQPLLFHQMPFAETQASFRLEPSLRPVLPDTVSS